MQNNAINEIAIYAKTILISAFTPSTWKFIFATIYVIYAFMFDVSKSQAFLSLVVLIIFDFITSIWAAKITGEPIRSAKIANSGVKLVAYFIVIAGAFQAERGLLLQISILDETVLAWFMARELISLIENVGRMGYETPQKLLNQLKNITDKK